MIYTLSGLIGEKYMKSFKDWKIINESLFPIGISKPNTVGGLMGQHHIEEAKKKMKISDDDVSSDDDSGDDVEEKSCSCNKNMKKKMKDSKQSPKDHSGEKSWSKEKKKKMGDEMELPMKKKKPVVDDEEDDIEDDEVEDNGDEEVVSDEEGDEDHDEGDEDHDEEGEGDEDHDEGENMKKYGFMKKGMKKKMKKGMKKKMQESDFYDDLNKYPNYPKDHSQDNEAEFFASLQRQFGKPLEKFSSGLTEDMLINSDNTEVVQNDEQPAPGEVGYAPQGKIGQIGSYVSEAADFEILKKYLGESAAKKLIEDK